MVMSSSYDSIEGNTPSSSNQDVDDDAHHRVNTNRPSQRPAAFFLVKTKQAHSFPVFIQHATDRPSPCRYNNNNNSAAAKGSSDYNGNNIKHHTQHPSRMVAQVATKYITPKPPSPAPGLQGDENGYLYVYQHVPDSPSPTNSGKSAEQLERNIERWERQRSTRQSINPAASSTAINKKPQTIYDVRSVYVRVTPDINKVSMPPPGTKRKPLDQATYENADVVSDLTRLMVTKMNIELEPNSYGLCTTCLRSCDTRGGLHRAGSALSHKCFCCNNAAKVFVAEVSTPLTERRCVRRITWRRLRNALRAGNQSAIGFCERLESRTIPSASRALSASSVWMACRSRSMPVTRSTALTTFILSFAPRCSVCREAIVPDAGTEETVRIVCMDRNFHPQVGIAVAVE
ncbi:hypothetical protein BV898_15907 [Hypsibius exemplaris]|uniref:Uncharacterized protein n=1 Tax=Hypsibius exemplaris TaxID=2072580 RepID=A0A9X6RKS6_HYPEX|nr:hypothetical protein BV898_15907 [Hypsibius exemplaris]